MAPPTRITRNPLDFAKITAGVDVQGNRGGWFSPPSGPADCPTGLAPAPSPRNLDISDAALVRLLFPPKVEKLASSQDFNVNDYRVILPAGVGSSVTPATLVFQTPKDQVGWLQQFSIYTLNPSALTYAQWTVLINGAPVSGFDNVANPPGIANLVEVFTNNMRVRIPMGAKVSLMITNLDASGPYTVGGKLAGWYHPKVAEDRAWGIDP